MRQNIVFDRLSDMLVIKKPIAPNPTTSAPQNQDSGLLMWIAFATTKPKHGAPACCSNPIAKPRFSWWYQLDRFQACLATWI